MEKRELVLCYRSSYSDVPFAVHAKGCSDVERTERLVNGAVVIDYVATIEEARDKMCDVEATDMGYDRDEHVKVFSCCEKEDK